MVQIQLDYSYFGIDNIQRNCNLFTETELHDCNRGSVTVCYANRAIYSMQELTCESSLYLQKACSHNLCRRRLLLNYRTPTIRHGSVWVYYFPGQQRITVRCRKNGTWSSGAQTLNNNEHPHEPNPLFTISCKL
jgi:hypothetical protein